MWQPLKRLSQNGLEKLSGSESSDKNFSISFKNETEAQINYYSNE
jgi:hypothetical protein